MKLLRKEMERHTDRVGKAVERIFPRWYANESFIVLYLYSHVGNDINWAICPNQKP